MKHLNTVIKYLLAIFLLVMTLLTFYQVIMRYIFNSTPSWTEEIVRFLFVWVSMVGAGIGIQEKAHIGIDVVVNLFPLKMRKAANILAHVIIIVLGAVIARYTVPVMQITSKQNAPATGLPMNYVYLATFVFGILCIFFSGVEIYRTVKAWNREEKVC